MTRPSPRTLALWLALVLLAVPARPAAAQAKKPAHAPATEAKDKEKADDAPKADDAEARPPSPFGDPKRFTRFGGWGSFGNAMGQFGFGRSTLVMSPAVQKELKLTEAQKDDLRKWLESLRKDGEDLGRRLRDQGEAADPFRGGGDGGDVPIAGRIMQFTGMIAQFSAMMQQNENGLARILTPAQRRRLDQIALQMEGVSALLRPEVAEAVNLGPVEQEMIQEILNNARTQQMGAWFGSMIRMRNAARPAPDADAADPPAEKSERPRSRTRTPAKADKPADDKAESDKPDADKPAEDNAEAARNKARAERQKAMRQQFEAMRDRTDGIQSDAVREVVRLLSKGQRARFEKLLGPPFDPSALNFGPPPQRPAAEPAR